MKRKVVFILPLSVFLLTSCVQPSQEQFPGGAGNVNPEYVKAAQFFNRMGMAAMVEENYSKAIANFKKAVKLNPKDPELWKNLGEAYTAAKFYKQAEEAFHKALALKPDYGEVYYDLGVLYTEWGKYGEAEKWFKKASSMDTYEDRYKAYHALAQLYEKQNRQNLYVKSLQKSVDLYPRYKKGLLELARYYVAKGEYSKAEGYYIKYLSVYPNDWKVAMEFAKVLAKEGKYTEAKRLLRRVIDTAQNPQVVEEAYRLVQQILVEEAKQKLEQEKKLKERQNIEGRLPERSTANPHVQFVSFKGIHKQSGNSHWTYAAGNGGYIGSLKLDPFKIDISDYFAVNFRNSHIDNHRTIFDHIFLNEVGDTGGGYKNIGIQGMFF